MLRRDVGLLAIRGWVLGLGSEWGLLSLPLTQLFVPLFSFQTHKKRFSNGKKRLPLWVKLCDKVNQLRLRWSRLFLP